MVSVRENIDVQLRTAASNDDIEHVRRLLVHGANPRASDAEGYTALHWAALWSTSPMVTLLLRHGAHPNAATHKGNAPLHFAMRRKDESIVEALRRGDADPHQRNRQGIAPLDQTRDPGLLGLLQHVFFREDPVAESVARQLDSEKVTRDVPSPVVKKPPTKARRWPTVIVDVDNHKDDEKEQPWQDKGEAAWNDWKRANAALLGVKK